MCLITDNVGVWTLYLHTNEYGIEFKFHIHPKKFQCKRHIWISALIPIICNQPTAQVKAQAIDKLIILFVNSEKT